MFVLADAKGRGILANCECPGKGREDRVATEDEVTNGAQLCRWQQGGYRISRKKGFLTKGVVKRCNM